MAKYTSEQIQQMRDVYSTSRGILTYALRTLQDDYGFRPPKEVLVKYWKPLGYVHPNTGGKRTSKHDRRFSVHGSQVDEVKKRRIFDAFKTIRENSEPLDKKELAGIFRITLREVRELVREYNKTSPNSDASLEERIQ